MACQTGIRANGDLLNFFSTKCKNGDIRIAKIIIKNEELTLNFHDRVSGAWETDFGRSLPSCLDSFEPCFILFRLDTKSDGCHFDWLLISFCDDSAAVRDKMLLAATRATLKSEFGQRYIRQEYQATSKSECTVDGYNRWLMSKEENGPMTHVERELLVAHEEEAAVQQRQKTANSLAAQTLRGLAFPIDQAVEEKLRELKSGTINYVQMSVDVLNEAIKLEEAASLKSAADIRKFLPRDRPRYHFFRFVHTFDGNQCDSIVFIYSMPTTGCSIKEKMLYSSCKAAFLDTAEKFIGLRPDRKMEIDGNEQMTDEYLIELLHPKHGHSPILFSKPKGPSGRGVRRITKPIATAN